MLLSSASLSFLCVPFPEIVAVVSWLWRYMTSPRPAQVDPLYTLTFIHTFLNILIECFGEVTAPVLRPQASGTTLVLLTNSSRRLQILIGTPSQRSQTLCATSFSLHLLSAKHTLCHWGFWTTRAFYSLISWRKAGFRYNYNDIVQTLGAVVNK
ncbi:hypothetical protein H4582DRAFT_1341119 [Lactarius indigo]|nr:hypothetical protein H4582DRAFT_1341119 [Lactarius indigo]